MRIMFLFFMFSGVFMAMGQTSRFTVKVLDHETGKPLSGMKVEGNVGTNIKPGMGWGTGKGIYVGGKETDANGCCTFTINGGNGAFGVRVYDQKGYYQRIGGGRYQKASGIFPFRRYQPWNPIIELRMVKKRNPIPMYVMQYRGKIPATEIPVGFDLLNGDWVQPYGKGENSDILFTLHIKKPPNEPANFWFDFELKLSFPNKYDGIQECVQEGINGMGEREFRILNMLTPPKEGYQNPYYKLSPGNNETHDEANTNFFFRVRSQPQADGHFKEGLYGKIYAPMECNSLSEFSFFYYLNPTPGDTNLEFDCKTTLLKNGIAPINQP